MRKSATLKKRVFFKEYIRPQEKNNASVCVLVCAPVCVRREGGRGNIGGKGKGALTQTLAQTLTQTKRGRKVEGGDLRPCLPLPS